jgi:hypothetical protein
VDPSQPVTPPTECSLNLSAAPDARLRYPVPGPVGSGSTSSRILDRGRDAVVRVGDELRAAIGGRRRLIVTGAGIRARHVLGVGLDLAEDAGGQSDQRRGRR